MSDFAPGTVLNFKFSTFLNLAPTTLAGTPAVSVYKDDSTTQSTAGVTLSVDFDGLTGLNNVKVDTSADGTFYSAGSKFDLVVTTGTVGGNSLVGFVIDDFTLNMTSALRPTTAGRTLDVSAGGEAGLDWANIGSPTTTQNLSGTNIDVDQVVASVSGAVGSVAGDIGGLAAGAATDVENAVWDAVQASHLAAGSTGESLADAAAGTNVPTPDENALALLKYDFDGITGEPTFSPLNAMRSTRNDWDTTTNPGKRTVFKEDGTTQAFAQTATVDPNADPVTGLTTP